MFLEIDISLFKEQAFLFILSHITLNNFCTGMNFHLHYGVLQVVNI